MGELMMVLSGTQTGTDPGGGDPGGGDPGGATYVTSETDIFQQPSIPMVSRGSSYVDSTFGTTITRISDPRTMSVSPTTTGPYGLLTEYSAYPGCSKNGTYTAMLCVGSSGGGWYAVYNVATGARASAFFSGGGTDPECLWDPDDDNVLWYLNSGWIMKREFPADTVTQVFRITQPSGTAYSYMRTGEEGRPSNDMRWHCFMGYMNPRTTATTGWIVFDRLNNVIYSRRSAVQYTDAIKTTPLTGQFIGIGDLASNHTVLYDRDLNFVRELHKHASHEDVAVGSDGEEYLVYMSQTGLQIAQTSNLQCMARVRISDGQRTIVPGRTSGTDHFPTSALHISGIVSADHPDWVLVSHYSSVAANPFIRPGDHEVWLQNFMTGAVKRIAHTHNFPDGVSGSKDYWAETQATSNWAGDKFFFKSNWNSVDPNKDISTYKIDGSFW